MKTRLLIIMSAMFYGCGGGSFIITAKNTDYPVSASNSVYNEKYQTITTEKELKVVGKLDLSPKAWSIFWTLLPLSNDVDISDDINASIRKVNGEAVVNLTVSTNPGMSGGFIINWFASFIPVIPGVVTAHFTGDIVKMKN